MISGIVHDVTLRKLAPGRIRCDTTTTAHFSSFERAENQAGKAEIRPRGRTVETLDAAFRDAGRNSVTFRKVAKGEYECNDPPLAFTRFSYSTTTTPGVLILEDILIL
jgi:hypothetical protein